MHTDLMCPPRLKPAIHKRKTFRCAKACNDTRPCHSVAPPIKENSLTLAVMLVTRELGLNFHHPPLFKAHTLCAPQARIRGVRNPINKRAIMPLDGVFLKLRCKPVVCDIRFCHNKKPARVFIDSVHDPGPCNSANATQRRPTVMHQSIYKRAVRRAWRGMNNHARRLVDDDKRVIFIDDLKRYLLRQDVALGRRRQHDLYQITLCNLGLRVLGHRTIDAHCSLFHKPCQPRTA